MNSFYDKSELAEIGFKSIGQDVFISRKASFYCADKMEIGNHVRIDDFCFLSGNIRLGNHIHLAVGCILYGSEKGITMEDFSGLSPRCVVHADSDDYSGEFMTNPMVDKKYTNVTFEPVNIGKHAILGSGCIVLPGANVGEGSCVGSMSLVKESTRPWTINIGIPSKEVKERSRRLLELEKEFLSNNEG